MGELKKIYIIARYTFYEIFHSRIIANVFFIGLALVTLSFVAAEFTYGVPQRIALDFGMGACHLSVVAISLFMGVNLLAQDIESRTAYMVLARPIHRSSFLLGKCIGMGCILLLNVLILGGFSIGSFTYLGGTLNPLIAFSFFATFLEGMILLLVVVFFSLITTKVMSVVYSFVVFVCGHAIVEAKVSRYVVARPSLQKLLDLYGVVFPNLNKLNLKEFVLYKQEISQAYLLSSFGYGILYCMALGLICCLILESKNLD